jgi:hypothetical protein
MSKKSSQFILYITCIVLLVISCKREDVATLLEGQTVDGQAHVKIIHASAYAVNYSAQLKVNDERVSNVITNATPFPGGGLNTGGASSPWYMALSPGNTAIALSVPKVGTSVDSIPLFKGSSTFESNKYYSAYLTDTGANTQMVVVNDDITLPANGLTRFKFINLMPNQPSMDLYAGTTKVASGVAYKATSPDFTLAKNDTVRWYIRPAGATPTSTPIAIYPALTPTFTSPMTVPNQRVMTVFARGYSGITTGNRLPNISLLYNH